MLRHAILRWTALCLALLLCCSPALASHGGVRAQANGSLPFRAGPGYDYPDLYTLPGSTRVAAIEQERGDGADWALCEFNYNGSRVRAYTELSNLSPEGAVPQARHFGIWTKLDAGAEVNAAPEVNSDLMGRSDGGYVQLLDYEGDFCFIEFGDGSGQRRGYIPGDYFYEYDMDYGPDFPDCHEDTMYVVAPSCPMYAEASDSSEVLFNLRYDDTVAVNFDEMTGDDHWVPVYYGGLRGYVEWGSISDLRGFAPN